jgi:putative selenium metabolism protein SsnA
MKTLLKNALIVEWAPTHAAGQKDILIEGDRITKIADSISSPSDTTELDCTGMIAIPALVVGHTHLYSSLATGMPPPEVSPTTFVEILEYVWWKLDRALDEEAVYYSALVGAVRAALCGTGTLVDHHASPSFIRGSLVTIRKALEQVGLRGVLCYEVTDRNGREGASLGIEENRDFLESGRTPGIYGGLVGAHASFTLEDKTLNELSELADTFKVGIHIHCAEADSDNEDALRRCGKRVIGRLYDYGILRPGTILVHGVHLTDSEVRLAYDCGCWLVHNPRSNMNNRVGYAPIEEMSRGRLALGTDGIDADMFAESTAAFYKARDAKAAVPFDAPLRWLGGSAQLASEYLGVQLGLIREGCVADIALMRYPLATPLTSENVAGHWIFGMGAHHVHGLMVGGKWILRDNELVDRNLYAELSQAQQVAKRVWKKLKSL